MKGVLCLESCIYNTLQTLLKKKRSFPKHVLKTAKWLFLCLNGQVNPDWDNWIWNLMISSKESIHLNILVSNLRFDLNWRSLNPGYMIDVWKKLEITFEPKPWTTPYVARQEGNEAFKRKTWKRFLAVVLFVIECMLFFYLLIRIGSIQITKILKSCISIQIVMFIWR